MKVDGAIPRRWPNVVDLPESRLESAQYPAEREPLTAAATRPARPLPMALHHRELQNFPVTADSVANPYLEWSDSRLAVELSNHLPLMEKHHDR